MADATPEVEPPPPPDPEPDPTPDPNRVYWSNAFLDRPILKPNDGIPALGIQTEPGNGMSVVGIAYPYTHVGGVTRATGPIDYSPPEVVFRLVLDRAWVAGRAIPLAKKLALDGRFVLRLGRFVELAEDAV